MKSDSAACFSSRLLQVLMSLLALDLVFVGLHCANVFLWGEQFPVLSLETDRRGVAELFQYLKEALLAGILLLGVLRGIHSRLMLSWVMLFGYVLLDDSLSIHERVGRWMTPVFQPLEGALRAADYGEMLTSVSAACILFGAIAFCYIRAGNSAYRDVSADLFGLFCVLAFFGVVVDMLHVVFSSGSDMIDLVFVVIEDGGEMLILSLLLVYAIYIFQVGHEQRRYVLRPLLLKVGKSVGLGKFLS